MALEHLRVIAVLAFVSQVITTYAPYIQYAGSPYPIPAFVTSYPAQSYTPSPAPIFTQPYSQPATNVQPFQPPALPAGAAANYAQTAPSYAPAHAPTSANTPSAPIYQPTAYQTSAYQRPIKATSVTPSPVPDPPKLDPIKSSPNILKETNSHTNLALPTDLMTAPTFDSNVLNNLAIALQLLIVSNLIHNPPPEPNLPKPHALDEDILPAIAPLPIAFIPPNPPASPNYSNQHIPNANFIGTSSFGDTGISKSMMSAYGSPTPPAPRSSGLMSPYDAIGPNSPYRDTFKTKSEIPAYHLSSDYKDLFSLTELFKI